MKLSEIGGEATPAAATVPMKLSQIGGAPPAAAPEPGIAESLWDGLKNFGAGVGRGISGAGVPAGKASEDPGGRSEFGGRMVGAGARSMAEGMWEAIKGPADAWSGKMGPMGGPEMQSRALGTAMVMAGQGGGRRPMVTREAPAARPGQLALPPPTMPVAGPPATSTGAGMMPPGPASTMTHPQASLPPTSPRVAAGLEPGPELGITNAVPTSPLADAIASNDGTAIDRHLTSTYRGAVKPKPLGTPGGVAGLTMQDQRITTAVDTILANKGTLRVTDAASGEKIPLPSRPNLMQFAEALNHTKQDIFRLYDDMAQAGQGEGVRVNLAPVVAKAREIGQGVQAQDLSPAAGSEAARLASVMESRGSYTPLEAQTMIEGINEISRSFWKGGGERLDTTSVGVLNQVAHVLREQLDNAISTQGGPSYQALKTRYGSLRSVEQEVATAVMKLANKPAGGLPYQFADMFSAEQFIHGVLDPTHFVRHGTNAVATLTGKRLLQYLRDPNRAIGRMFDRRSTELQRPGGKNLNQQNLVMPGEAGSTGTAFPALGALSGLAGADQRPPPPPGSTYANPQ